MQEGLQSLNNKENNYILKTIKFSDGFEIERFFTNKELFNLKLLDPLFYADQYFSSHDFEKSKNEGLRIYFFFEIERLFGIIFRRFLKTKDEDLFISAKEEFYRFYSFKNILDNNEFKKDGVDLPDNFSAPDIIIEMYEYIKNIRNKLNNKECKKEDVLIEKLFENKKNIKLDWQYKSINNIRKDINRKLAEYVKLSVLHGSFGSGDFLKKWSDLDLIIVLKGSVFSSVNSLSFVKKELMKLSFYCYKIDPLAHHEFIFITEDSLLHYSSSEFPPSLFKFGLHLTGEKKFTVCTRVSKEEKVQALFKILHNFRLKILNNMYSKNKFLWKNDLSIIMIIPSMLLQLRDIIVYKKYSFDLVKQEFPKLDFSVIDQATYTMNSWRKINVLRYYPDIFIEIMPYYINRKIFGLVKRFSQNSKPDEKEQEIKNITQNFYIFLSRIPDIFLD